MRTQLHACRDAEAALLYGHPAIRTHLTFTDIDLQASHLRMTQGPKGTKDRYILFPQSFRGELAQYVERSKHNWQHTCFDRSNAVSFTSTRRLRQLVSTILALAAGITKRAIPVFSTMVC